MTKKERQAAIQHMEANKKAMKERFSTNVITVMEDKVWDYAIPENYFQTDGFIWGKQTGDPWGKKGTPVLRWGGEILYLYYVVQYHELEPDDKERLLCFDRNGSLYTFAVKHNTDYDVCCMNPSYERFVDKVEFFKGSRCQRQCAIKDHGKKILDDICKALKTLEDFKKDSEYILTYDVQPAVLWREPTSEHIEKMKAVYNKIPKLVRPDWISLEEIEYYQEVMEG